MANDLTPIDFPPFDWADPKTSLDAYFARAVAQANDAIHWYWRGIKGKRLCAACLRGSMIFLGGVAAVLPTVAEILKSQKWQFSGAWASVIGVLVAVLLLFDRFMGASTGWVRYIKAQLQLKTVLEKLSFAYNAEKGNWIGGNPTNEQAHKTLDLLSGFVSQINDIVTSETNQWAAEFQGALQSMEEFAKALPKTSTQGSLTVTIKCALPLSADWKLYLDGQQQSSGRSESWAKVLIPGMYQVRVEAMATKTVNNAPVDAPVSAEGVATVPPAGSFTLALNLA